MDAQVFIIIFCIFLDAYTTFHNNSLKTASGNFCFQPRWSIRKWAYPHAWEKRREQCVRNKPLNYRQWRTVIPERWEAYKGSPVVAELMALRVFPGCGVERRIRDGAQQTACHESELRVGEWRRSEQRGERCTGRTPAMYQGFASATWHVCKEVMCSWGKNQLRLEGTVPTSNTELSTVSVPTHQIAKAPSVISRRVLPQ